MKPEHLEFWEEAFIEAKKAENLNEVPVGAVIVQNGVIVGRGHNQRITQNNALLHAEIVAIADACKILGTWRLDHCEMFITLEPCAMCTGASIESRLKKIYFGALDEKTGCVLSQYTLLDDHLLPHRVEYEYVPQEPCKQILIDFFSTKR
jgi:tRNA(adenine34) deaminase